MQGILTGCEVYLDATGTVVRCRACRAALMVLVEVRRVTWLQDLGAGSAPAPKPL